MGPWGTTHFRLLRHDYWSKWAEVFRTTARLSLTNLLFLVSVELCTVLESEDTGSDVFSVLFSIVRSFKDESHDMMPSSLRSWC